MDAPPVPVVCIMHGGFRIPPWLAHASRVGKVYLTLNDPDEHEYRDIPAESVVTVNPEPRGFAENVNAALRRVFSDGAASACVVNFDLEMSWESLGALASVLETNDRLGAVGTQLSGHDGREIFSVGTIPTPLREFLRAAGLRTGLLFTLQRAIIRHTKAWSARNAAPDSGVRVLDRHEYLPWTCIAIRRAAWDAIGELDQRFPMYGEDIDWSLRCHQGDWELGLANCGRVVHFERATRSPRSDTFYEYSHLALHRKWGWHANLTWQRRALELRRRAPLSAVTPPIDWCLLSALDRDASDGERWTRPTS